MNEPTEYPTLLALLTALEGTDHPVVHLACAARSDWRYRVYPPTWGQREIGAFTDEGWVHAGHASRD